MKDGTFSVVAGEHQVAVGGKIIPAVWADKGAAAAGLAVEQRRAAAKALKQNGAALQEPRYSREDVLQICHDHPMHMADHVARLYREIERLSTAKPEQTTCEKRGGCFGGDCCLR